VKQVYILFLISFVTAALITIPAFRALALRFNIVDAPDGNLKKHHRATPYLGGIGVFTALWIVLLASVGFSGILPGLFFGTLFILIVGLIDDVFLLSPLEKLVGQLCSALIFVGNGFSITLGLPFYGDQILSVFWLVSLMNAFNLIDVMDGLATTVSMSATCGLIGYVAYLKQFDLLVLLVVFLGTQLAFFYYNRPCATIYLGDAGSMFLGAMIGALTLKANWMNLGNCATINYLISPLIIGIPIVEVCSLIIIRRFKNIPFYAGSRDHYIHYLKRKNWSEYDILVFTLFFSILLCIISIMIVSIGSSFISFVLFGLIALALWLNVVFC